MEVKVQCGCGTRFAFDVEPVNGRMPMRIKCPGCGADGTELANEVIRQRLATTVAAIPVAPVAAAAVAAAPMATASVPFCPRHPKNPATETCRVCGKPICDECLEQFGYVCSTYCRKRAEQTGMDVPVYEKQRAVIEARVAWVAALIVRAVVFLVVVLAGAWIWYTFFGSQPRVIYSEQLPHGDRARCYQFLVPNQVLSIKASQMSLFDLAEQRQLWSVALNSGIPAPGPLNPGRGEIEETGRLNPAPHIIATTNDLWILFPGRIAQYDRHTGNRKQEIPLNPPFFGLAQSDSGMTVISSDESGRETITRIAFSNGTVQTTPIESVAAVASPSKSQPPPTTITVSTNSAGYETLAKLVAAKAIKLVERTSWGDKFVPDGADVVQMKVDLIERKTIIHLAMKAQKKSLVEDNLTSGQSLEASEQMINDLRREQTGGVEEEDVSRYQVTLRRWPAGTAPDWTGEVIGAPLFFALKTRDILVAGNSIHVFDKNNQKLWTASLTYSTPPHYSEDFATEADPPCVESGNTLYVFDRGMLTSFDAATGQVHWRLTSVGISQVQLDGKGNLYVTSTTASPDAIQFSQQFSLSSKVNPVILKVDATTGRVLWRNEGIGDKCFLSGKFIYAARAAKNPSITPGEDPVLYFDLYRLSPSDGHAMWDYSQFRHPVQIEVQENRILLHFRGELQVLKFSSL
jgi:hypothetical protein